ncbi:MAG: hypothetical protein ABSC03_09150, partial [Verrucomicrobiota bacterium]
KGSQPLAQSSLLGHWCACKRRFKSALGTLPEYRIASRWLTKHDRVVGTLWAIWSLPETVACAFPQHTLKLSEGTHDWLRILKLCAKLCNLQLKLRILALKRRYLLREQRRLLLQQVNHVFGQTGSGGEADNFFCSVSGAHNGGAKWPTGQIDAPVSGSRPPCDAAHETPSTEKPTIPPVVGG